jgi:hypothetical protein
MPRPPEALLDSFGGSLTRAEVQFQPGGSGTVKTYANSRWNLNLEAVLHATGRLSSRVVGNQFRERLVSDPNYVVESRGADTENTFDMDLVTSTLFPAEPVAPPPPVPAPGALGASVRPDGSVGPGGGSDGSNPGGPGTPRQTASSTTHAGPGGAP